MRLTSSILSATACLCLGLAVPATAASTVSSTDAVFLRSAAQGADYELAIARLAQEKATRTDVKDYANTLVTDHEQLNSDLHKLTESKGVTWPTGMEQSKQSKLVKLKAMSGPAFDTAFLADEVQVNKEDKGDLQKEMSTKDADVKAFAERMQSADAKHTQLGKNLQKAG